jgi:protein TonB
MTAAVAQPAPRHWSFALSGALLLHAGLALVFHQMLDTGAAGAGRAGIEVGLGPAGGAPGEAGGAAASQEVAEALPDAAPEAETVPAQAAEVPPETLDPIVPPETVVATLPPPAAEAVVPEVAAAPEAVPLYAPVESVPELSEAAPAETVTAEPLPPEAAEAVAEEVPKVETAETAAAEVVPVEVVEAPAETIVAEPAMPAPPLPRAKPKPPETTVPIEPKPVAEPAPEPQEVAAEAAAAQAAPSTTTTQGPSGQTVQAGTDGKAGSGARTASGTIESRSGGGNPGAMVDYAARLNAWLERHKEYPRRASLRRQEGEATLYFVIDRAGRVLDFRVEKSTGYKILDEEVVNMIKRASPLPAPPESLAGETLEYRVPVGFDQH